MNIKYFPLAMPAWLWDFLEAQNRKGLRVIEVPSMRIIVDGCWVLCKRTNKYLAPGWRWGDSFFSSSADTSLSWGPIVICLQKYGVILYLYCICSLYLYCIYRLTWSTPVSRWMGWMGVEISVRLYNKGAPLCSANNQNVSDRATYSPLTLVHVGPK